jgi:hypothetical protein
MLDMRVERFSLLYTRPAPRLNVFPTNRWIQQLKGVFLYAPYTANGTFSNR